MSENKNMNVPIDDSDDCTRSIAVMRRCGCLSPEEADARQKKVWDSYEVVFSRNEDSL